MNTMDYPDYESPLVVGEPNDNDVLLGRGNHVNYRPGNVRFRQLASAKSLAYTNARTKKEKDAIAAQLIQEVSESGGRFLREVVSSSTDQKQLCAVWEVMTGQIVSTKVRQAMRDTLKAKGEAQTSTGGSPMLRGQRSNADIGKYKNPDKTDLHPLRCFEVAEKARRLLENPIGNYQASQSGVRPTKILAQHISGFEDHSKPTSSGIHQLHESLAQSFPTGGHALNSDDASWQPASATTLEGIPQQHIMLQEHPPASPFTGGTSAAYSAGLFGLGNPPCSNGPQLIQHLILQKTLQNQLVLSAGGQQLEEANDPLLHCGQQHQLQLVWDPVLPLLPPLDGTASSANNFCLPPELPPSNGIMGTAVPWIVHQQQSTMYTNAVSPMAQDNHDGEQHAMLQTFQPLPLFDDASASCHVPSSEDYLLQENMDWA